MYRMDYATYMDKVYGGWIGKCAGGLIGAKQENNKSLMDYSFDNVFPDKIPPNDDLDLQILYLNEVLEKQGFSFDTIDLAEAFAKYNMCWANEYRIAIRNVNRKIYPPVSGEYNNDFFKNSMGCPIRSELWGMIGAGNPKLCCKFVEMDGPIDHSVESIEMEKYLAITESLAFFRHDLPMLLREGITYISQNSRVQKAVEKVFEVKEREPDYRKAREELVAEFGSSDASYCIMNLCIILTALLYGEGNFNDTMLIAVNCGYDTDCTSATCGSILGILNGKSRLPAEWLEKVGETFVVGTVNINRERNKILQLAEDTVKLTCAAIRDGVNECFVLSGVPANIADSIPVKREKVRIFARYKDLPVISGEKDCLFDLVIVNERGTDFKGELILSGEYLHIEAEKTQICVGAKSEERVAVRAKLKAGERVHNCLVVRAELDIGGEKVIREVGMQVAAKYKIVGPFFDNYDTTKYERDIHNGCMPKDLFDMFNNYVNVDREYIPETFEGIEERISKVMLAERDVLPVEDYISYKGSCCVYLVRDIWCREDKTVHMFFGDTTPYKVFLNGELVSWGHRFCAWMPLNQVAEVKLKKGKNRFVYKLTRYNGEFIFSTFFSELSFGNGVAVSFEEENI